MNEIINIIENSIGEIKSLFLVITVSVVEKEFKSAGKGTKSVGGFNILYMEIVYSSVLVIPLYTYHF